MDEEKDKLKNLIKELRSTLARTELVLGIVDEAIIWTNLKGEIVWCNIAFDRLVSCPHILVLGNVITEIFPLLTEDKEACNDDHPFRKAIASHAKGSQTYYFKQKQEEFRYLEIHWSYFQAQFDNNNEAGCVLTIRDRTDLQRLIQDQVMSQFLLEKQSLALQKTQLELSRIEQTTQELKLIETLLDAALTGYWDWNLVTGNEYLSPTLKRIFGYDDQESSSTLLTTWKNLIFAEDKAKFYQGFMAHVQSKGKEPLYVELRCHHQSGSVVWVIFIGLVISWDDQGNPLRMVGYHIDITRQKRVEEKLRSSIQDKELLLKEIHHRVKNNLLIVSSLLSWQEEKIDDPKILQLLSDSQKRINAIALIHEKLYLSPKLTHIDFGDYFKSLVAQIVDVSSSSLQLIQLHFSVCSMLLNIETVTPCSLIINELILNSIEHAFSGHKDGNLFLGLTQDNAGNITLTVQDDGPGFPDGFDFRQTESLGWQLICLLSEQLEADLQVRSKPGLEVTLTFQELSYRERL
ncbi:MAG: histidine kinase dimerization/phosphoacceptor domain -containing protein [Leptolyngbya sp.]|nr:histidine kinase dimerization/phosphoacceptor domain -containing protein [Leptolyngbya sp.]